MIKLDIFSDPVCPWCYIGFHNLFKVLNGKNEDIFSIEWHPFQLNPDMPKIGMDRRKYLEEKFGGKDAAIQAYLPIAEHASAAGLNFDFEAIQKTPNTLMAHCFTHWAKLEGCQTEVVKALFAAYFCQGRDIGDIKVLVDISAEIGMDPDATNHLLMSGADREEIKEKDMAAREMGVQAVPTFVVAGQHVVGGAQPIEMWQSVVKDIRSQLAV